MSTENIIILDCKESDPARGGSVILHQSKSFYGPYSKEKSKTSKKVSLALSARATAKAGSFGLAVSPTSEEVAINRPGNMSVALVEHTTQEFYKKAVITMQAFAEVTGEKEGTPDYLEKKQAFLVEKEKYLNSMGLAVGKDGKRVLMSGVQKELFAEHMAKFTFPYYQYHVTVKADDAKRGIQSKTFRTLRPISESLAAQVAKAYPNVSRRVSFINDNTPTANNPLNG